jgi:hypothetical protein
MTNSIAVPLKLGGRCRNRRIQHHNQITHRHSLRPSPSKLRRPTGHRTRQPPRSNRPTNRRSLLQPILPLHTNPIALHRKPSSKDPIQGQQQTPREPRTRPRRILRPCALRSSFSCFPRSPANPFRPFDCYAYGHYNTLDQRRKYTPTSQPHSLLLEPSHSTLRCRS